MKLIDARVIEVIHTTVGLLIFIRCPVELERDNLELFKQIVGDSIEYQGKVYPLRGVESHRLAAPMRVGEVIGLLV